MVARNPLFRGWDPWREMGRLQQEMNRVFGSDRSGGLFADAPAINVWRNENGVVLTSEIPGLDKNDLEISVTGETVTIRGTRKANDALQDKNAKYHRQERLTGKFSRSLQLPFRVDAQKTEAKYEQGILTVTLVPHEEEKPKKIAISPG